jgi:DNA repair exonuclease SbcCD ATPase subunit
MMQRAFLDWLSDILANWFIPRDDYDAVQERLWRAISEAQRADERADAAIRETHELLTESYDRNYRPFETYADAAKVREFKHEDISFQGETWGWQIRLPDWRVYTMRDPESEHRAIKERAAEELALKFKEHIRSKLFGEAAQV